MEKIKPNGCLLEDGKCEKENCEKCGWHAANVVKYELVLRNQGLTMCDDGLMRLISDEEDE